ncbi:MAG: helix-turn-helix domain-containing protein [Gammaproteobacteria bacterium]
MTPADLKSARKQLGLTQTQLAERLRMGKNGGRTVRRWESGDCPIPGPVEVAIEFLLPQS